MDLLFVVVYFEDLLDVLWIEFDVDCVKVYVFGVLFE